MSFNYKHYPNNVLFLPLGGTNEIGMNVSLYCYAGKWLMVDCGSGFADDYLPGVEMIIPDTSFIEKHKKDLIGLVLTHAHEDHLGAVQYLWQNLRCKIYATTFTANFLKSKVNEYDFAKDMQIITVTPSSKIALDPFLIEMIPLTHSAPEMQALMIRTAAGNILHTGDWKFDHDPVIGERGDERLLKQYGKEGVLALICDSTNVFTAGTSGSEGDLRKSLIDVISGCQQMVVVTTFASNLARLDTLISTAEKIGRKVVLAGRSMHRIFAVAQDSGYLKDVKSLVDSSNISRFDRKELLIITTGCQGEPLAAISKIVNNTHPNIKLLPKDTVIFSSKIIPGNEKKIFRLFNSLIRLGVEVITERDHFVHVSGHPAIAELTKMHTLTKPQICIPVHGEPTHLHEHVKLAKANKIKHAIEVSNGSVVLLDPKNPRIIDIVKNGYLAVDGNSLLPAESPIFKARRRMRESGIVIISLILSSTGARMAAPPILSTPGLFDDAKDEQWINIIKLDITEKFNLFCTQNKGNIVDAQLEGMIISTVRKTLKHELNKSPTIIVNIERLS